MDIQKIKEAGKYHKLFQGLLALISNHRAGLNVADPDFHISAIGKAEGGVVVNHAEIVILFNRYDDKIACYDDFVRKNRREPEIVEKVVEDLLTEIDWNGTTAVPLQAQIESRYIP